MFPSRDTNLRRGQVPETPAEIFPSLLEAVQLSRIFDDGKVFVDARPLRDPQVIMSDFERDRPQDASTLAAFVDRNFAIEQNLAVPARAARADGVSGMRSHIRALWPSLTRVDRADSSGMSAICVPGRYVVPGGRFRELYYWDSYFTMLGLRADGRSDLVDSTLDQFTWLIEEFGYVPNSTRSYMLSRSQPPLYFLMCGLSEMRDRATVNRRLAAMIGEHSFWMRDVNTLKPGMSGRHSVRLRNGAILNRYWDERAVPREESFREDVLVAKVSDRPEADVYRDLRAGAESGWDFSSRWLLDGRSLATIRTTSILPIDLNSLLYGLETSIASTARDIGHFEANRLYSALARRRAQAINELLYDEDSGLLRDFDWELDRFTSSPTAASLVPLFVGLATNLQAEATARFVSDNLLATGGLRTTLHSTDQQWDMPNGWAPLQWFAVKGLQRYGFNDLARTIAERWVATVTSCFESLGGLLEKYDIEQVAAGGGGEYGVQDGFGWTNGVTAALIDEFCLG